MKTEKKGVFFREKNTMNLHFPVHQTYSLNLNESENYYIVQDYEKTIPGKCLFNNNMLAYVFDVVMFEFSYGNREKEQYINKSVYLKLWPFL